MKVLFVDDEFNHIDIAMKHLTANGYLCKHSSFEDFVPNNEEFDIVIIDMIKGKIVDDPKGDSGREIIDQIWGANFCPIIIYSASPSLADIDRHPLVAKVKKGAGSEERILSIIKRMGMFIEAKHDILRYAEVAIKEVLFKTVPVFFSEIENESDIAAEEEQRLFEKIRIVFPRIIRRRVAASFDSGYNTVKLLPYEQYLFPPIGDNWLQGDIIRKNNEFLLVLTPSCDLVHYEDGYKTRSVLCAKCEAFTKEHIKRFFFYTLKAKGCEKCNTCEIDSLGCRDKRLKKQQSEEKKQLESFLNSGLLGDYYVLPALPGKTENLLADLKNLITFPVEEMGDYTRLVSIDSPFREKLNEAFIRTACRIGAPDRDFTDLVLDCCVPAVDK